MSSGLTDDAMTGAGVVREAEQGVIYCEVQSRGGYCEDSDDHILNTLILFHT